MAPGASLAATLGSVVLHALNPCRASLRSILPLHRKKPGADLGFLLLVLCACGSPNEPLPEPAPPAPGDEQAVLGTGEAAFEPIDGEPRLRLVAGVQGGFHVWASFLVYGFSADRLDMVLETRVEDDPLTSIVMRARLNLRTGLDANGQPVQSFAGFPAQVYDARCAQDKRVRVELNLTDADGSVVSDARYCIAEVDEQQRRDDCD
jgi:hypothetical protein